MAQRFSHLRTRYGITQEQYQTLYDKQNGLCAGCGRLPKSGGKGNANAVLFVDHDHYTDEVRGLLCQGCNAAVGLAQDNPQVLRALADYLEKDVAIPLSDIISKDRGRRMRDRTNCSKGHKYTPENTRIRKFTGRQNPGRICVACERDYEKRRYRNKKIQASATGNARVMEIT